jgi:hypothetical protein
LYKRPGTAIQPSATNKSRLEVEGSFKNKVSYGVRMGNSIEATTPLSTSNNWDSAGIMEEGRSLRKVVEAMSSSLVADMAMRGSNIRGGSRCYSSSRVVAAENFTALALLDGRGRQ